MVQFSGVRSASLRRRGKIVNGAGFSDASYALIRECYEYIDLSNTFLKEDVAAYQIFKENGIAYKWLFDEVKCAHNIQDPSKHIEFSMGWQYVPPDYRISFFTKGSSDISDRWESIEDLQDKFNLKEEFEYPGRITLILNSITWAGIEKRLNNFISVLRNAHEYPALIWGLGRGFYIKYSFDTDHNRYIISPD